MYRNFMNIDVNNGDKIILKNKNDNIIDFENLKFAIFQRANVTVNPAGGTIGSFCFKLNNDTIEASLDSSADSVTLSIGIKREWTIEVKVGDDYVERPYQIFKRVSAGDWCIKLCNEKICG